MWFETITSTNSHTDSSAYDSMSIATMSMYTTDPCAFPDEVFHQLLSWICSVSPPISFLCRQWRKARYRDTKRVQSIVIVAWNAISAVSVFSSSWYTTARGTVASRIILLKSNAVWRELYDRTKQLVAGYVPTPVIKHNEGTTMTKLAYRVALQMTHTRHIFINSQSVQ